MERLLGVTESCAGGSAEPAQPDVQVIVSKIRTTNTTTWRTDEITIWNSPLPASDYFSYLNSRTVKALAGGARLVQC
jgi:hypothetical protein